MSKNFRAGTRRTPPKIYKVSRCDKLNLRRGPGTDHDVSLVLNKGNELVGLPDEDMEWIRVTYTGGDKPITGYCMRKFLDEVGDYVPDNS